jgi:hypothetical protein
MKKFFKKIFFMIILLLFTLAGIIFLIPLPENSYDLAIIDKHRILTNTKSPKIVLAGGSNLAFGIDSAEIENEINIPVVNMGLHAGIGLGRILDDISPFLNSGDILLIVPEYSSFGWWNGSETAYELIFDVRQYRLLWSLYYGLPSSFSNYLITHLYGIIYKTVNYSNPLAYSRDGFNEYGDYVKHLDKESRPFNSFGDCRTNKQTYLNHFFYFVDDFSMRGIKVLLSYPCYDEQSFRNSATYIQELDTEFRAKKNLLVISTPQSYCYQVNYFYDVVYHLNKEGRSRRTGQLIQDLKASGLLNISPIHHE